VREVDLEYSWMFRVEFPAVLQTVFLILHDRGGAEDVTQEAFIQLFKHWSKVSKYERPDAWVRRVAIRLAIRRAKRDRMRSVLEHGSEQARDLDVPDVDVARATQLLPPMQRAAVVLFYFEDRPVADIAHILGVSDGTVKQHLHRARQQLAKLLEEEVGDDAR
jgi:RNA polymerase sigma factor (sigma-70 family)